VQENSNFLRAQGLNGLEKLSIAEVTEEAQIPENVGKKQTLMPEPGKPLIYFDTA